MNARRNGKTMALIAALANVSDSSKSIRPRAKLSLRTARMEKGLCVARKREGLAALLVEKR